MNLKVYFNIGLVLALIAIFAFQYFYKPPFKDHFPRPLFKYDFSACVKNQSLELIKTVTEEKDNNQITNEEMKILQSLADNDLDPEDSILLCRLFGEESPLLQKHWPAKQVTRKIYAVDAYSHEFITTAESIFDRVSHYLESEWFFQFSTTIHIILASDTKELGALIPNNIPNDATQSMLDNACNSHEPGGLAFGPVLVICLTGDTETDNLSIQNTLAHEIFHSVQTELTGLGVLHSSYEEKLVRNGPSWMIEGCATAFADLHEARHLKWSEEKIQYEIEKLKLSINHLKYADYQRFSIENNESFKELYLDSTIFCHFLIKMHGEKSIMDFYSNIPHDSAGWEILFESIFNITPNDFISSFKLEKS